MKYMGSKARFAKEILPIVLKDRTPEQWYVEPFAGGMNMICEVNGNRIANDLHPYLIAMWKELVNGWIPEKCTRAYHKMIKDCGDLLVPAHEIGWIGFNCSYSGVYFGGYAGETKTKTGVRDYQREAISNVLSQVPKMIGVRFENKPYYDLEIPKYSVIYCDPPYEGTSGYKVDSFDHTAFWQWARERATEGHTVFVSEYNAPPDFILLWQKETKSSLSANGKGGSSIESIEKLFTFDPLLA